jgi:hypothetical protein
MTFIHAYLLAGLALAGVPILLHLIMRQKPRRLPFPAFRFLRQRHRINQRKLRLQHLLLLILRCLIIAALCLALARPRVFSSRLNLGTERAVTAVLIFDTSPSMEYAIAGQTRLDEARQRARELLEELKGESRVAILDSADDSTDTLLPPAEALARLDALRIRPANPTLNHALSRAARLLQEAGEGENAPPRFLYVFSDRTRACWDPVLRTPPLPEGVAAAFVDVGVDNPRDLAIDKVEVDPPVVAPGRPYQVRVTIRGTGPEQENELTCQLDNDPNAERVVDRRPIHIGQGPTNEVIVFDRIAPTPPDGLADVPYQVTVKLATRDNLPFNNTRCTTFVVRRPRKILAIADKSPRSPDDWRRLWADLVEPKGNFLCDVKGSAQADKLTPRQLGAYKVICLFQVVNPPESLWNKLAGYVRDGGGLTIVPGGDEMAAHVANYNKHAGAEGLLPARLDRLLDAPRNKLVYLSPFRGEHPLLAPFQKWSRGANPDFAQPDLRPFVRRYWKVEPVGRTSITINTYADPQRNPCLVEKRLGKGRVVQFTVPLDGRVLDPEHKQSTNYWQNFWRDSSFGVILADRICLYLAGETALPELNYRCGQVPQVTLPGSLFLPLSVRGPGLSAAEQAVKPPGEGAALHRIAVPQALAPGNFAIVDGQGAMVAGFSLTVSTEENDLDRAPIEEIEAVLGPRSVLQVGRAVSLQDALEAMRPPPVELLPYLMMALLLILTVESVLANKFYRRQAPVPGEDQPVQADNAEPQKVQP